MWQPQEDNTYNDLRENSIRQWLEDMSRHEDVAVRGGVKVTAEYLKDLKKQGVWVFGTAADGNTTLYNADLKGPAAIVIGSEGTGMTRLAAENCDFLVSIPMKGKISSLNASAAAAILLYEAVRQRG